MPFEFTGEAPSLGSTSDAFKPFSFSATTTGTTAASLSFGASSSFGVTAVSSKPSSFASSWSNPTAPQITTPKNSESIKADDDKTNSTSTADLAKISSSNSTLSRALHRASLKRPAIIGDAEIAADKLIAGHSEAEGLQDGREKVDNFANLVNKLAESSSEIQQFVRYVFDRATNPRLLDQKEKAQNLEDLQPTPELERPKSPSPEDDDDEDGFLDIKPGTPLYRACGAKISDIFNSSNFYHYNSYDRIATDVMEMIAYCAPKAEVKGFLASGAMGLFTPSTNPARHVDEIVDELWEGIVHVKKEAKDGWSVKGKDETSYFCKTVDDPSKARLMPTYWSKGQPKKAARMMPRYCCHPGIPFPTKRELGEPADDKPFQFMKLPPELRNHVYRHLLAPGTVPLYICRHKKARGTGRRLTTNILQASKQVYDEAADLIYENEFEVVLMPSSDPKSLAREVFTRFQLPQHACEKIKSLFLVLDCVEFAGIYCDWSPLQALVSLRTLRITAIEEEKFPVRFSELTDLLIEICMRVPAECTVQYGCKTKAQMDFADRMLETLQAKELWRKTDRPVGAVREVDEADLEQAGEDIPDAVQQGVRSGEASKSRWVLPGDLKGLAGLGELKSLSESAKSMKTGSVQTDSDKIGVDGTESTEKEAGKLKNEIE